MFLHKTCMALNGLLCADVPLRNCSLTHSFPIILVCIPLKSIHNSTNHRDIIDRAYICLFSHYRVTFRPKP